MWDTPSFPGIDLAAGTVTLPWWAAASVAGLLLIFLLLAMVRAGAGHTIGAAIRLAAVALAAWAAWTYVDRTGEQARRDEKQALDIRIADLSSRVIASNSALACLDGAAGETMESACERAIFASPETVASTTSYVAAKMALLGEAVELTRRDPSYTATLANLRRPLEADRFGVVAHVMMVRDGCSLNQCDTLGMLQDPNRVRSNLNERTFETLVTRYSAGWPARGRQPAAVSTAPAPMQTGSSGALSFPSAASIPPVSIMNTEPMQPPSPAPAAAAPAPVPMPAATPARKPPAPKPAAHATRPPPPVQISPSASAAPPPRTQ